MASSSVWTEQYVAIYAWYRIAVLANRVAETQFGMSRDAIVGKTALDLFPKEAAEVIAADDEKALQCPEGLFLDISPWQSQAAGQRFITSRRIEIPDQAGQTRYIINVVDDVTDRRRADEKIAHLAHYDALTDLPNRVLFRERIERELQRTSRGAFSSHCSISTLTSSRGSTNRSDIMSATNCSRRWRPASGTASGRMRSCLPGLGGDDSR